MSTTAKFPLGIVVMTRGIAALYSDRRDLLAILLERHHTGDWGDLMLEDIQANNNALQSGQRLFSSYILTDGKIWIITEADRSSTTLLLPEEY